jgi:hypothetical protein
MDDYSYAPSDGGSTPVPNNHIIVLQAGSVAWGVLP